MPDDKPFGHVPLYRDAIGTGVTVDLLRCEFYGTGPFYAESPDRRSQLSVYRAPNGTWLVLRRVYEREAAEWIKKADQADAITAMNAAEWVLDLEPDLHSALSCRTLCRILADCLLACRRDPRNLDELRKVYRLLLREYGECVVLRPDLDSPLPSVAGLKHLVQRLSYLDPQWRHDSLTDDVATLFEHYPETEASDLESAPPVSGTENPASAIRSHQHEVDPYDDLIVKLQKGKARTQVALLKFMRDRSRAELQDIAHHVHGDDQTSDAAIRANVKRTNESLESVSLPIKFRIGTGVVFKEELPE